MAPFSRYPSITGMLLDVTNEAQVEAVVKKIASESPEGLYALVNNAGFEQYGATEWCSLEHFKAYVLALAWDILCLDSTHDMTDGRNVSLHTHKTKHTQAHGGELFRAPARHQGLPAAPQKVRADRRRKRPADHQRQFDKRPPPGPAHEGWWVRSDACFFIRPLLTARDND